MKIVSISGFGSFRIEKNNFKALELNYGKWFSSDASTVNNGTEIEIKHRNWSSTKFDVCKNGVDKGDVIFTWNGPVKINVALGADDNEKQYVLTPKGFWQQYFEFGTNLYMNLMSAAVG